MSDVSQETLRSNWNIQAQIEQKRAGKRKIVFHGGTLCSFCYEAPPRAGQRTCAGCHVAGEKRRQKARRDELKALRSSHPNLQKARA